VRVHFSEFALAGIQKEVSDISRQAWCKASLTFYLRRDHDRIAEPCPAFTDKRLYIYAWSNWRVLFELRSDGDVMVWYFRRSVPD
jgi:hypothetical protein